MGMATPGPICDHVHHSNYGPELCPWCQALRLRSKLDDLTTLASRREQERDLARSELAHATECEEATRAELEESREQCNEYAERVREAQRAAQCEKAVAADMGRVAFRETERAERRDAWAKRWKACAKDLRGRIRSMYYHGVTRDLLCTMAAEDYAYARETLRAAHAALQGQQCPTCTRAAEELLRREPWLEAKR